jgi:hypothetical protein
MFLSSSKTERQIEKKERIYQNITNRKKNEMEHQYLSSFLCLKQKNKHKRKKDTQTERKMK